MKKLISAVLAVMLLLCSLTALAEDCAVGAHFYLDGNSGYSVEYIEEDDIYMIWNDNAMFAVSVLDLGLDMAQFEALYGSNYSAELLEALSGDVNIEKTLSVANGIPWIGFAGQYGSGSLKTAVALSGSYIFQAADFMSNDYTQLTALMSALHAVGDARPQTTAESANTDATWQKLSGWYDMLLNGIDQDISVIITPNGMVRLNNSTGTLCPDCVLKDGKAVDENGDVIFTVNADGTLSMLGMTMVKRPDVTGHDDFLGAWKLTRIISGTQDYRADALKTQGIAIDFVAYANGTIDWHSVTDSVSNVAQGWGVDGANFYIFNGSAKSVCTLDGDELSFTLTAPNGFQRVTYCFVRTEA